MMLHRLEMSLHRLEMFLHGLEMLLHRVATSFQMSVVPFWEERLI